MEEKKQFVKVEKNLVVAIIQYFEKQPLNEVVGFWNALRQSAPVLEEQKKLEAKKTEDKK